MDKLVAFVLFGLAVVASGLPEQSILRKLSSGPRFDYAQHADGSLHLVDLWRSLSDVADTARFNPDTQNEYHLFTRKNPRVSQVLVPGNDALLFNSNFNATKRTAVLVHGLGDNVTGNYYAVMVSAFLAAADMNVIAVDWSVGASAWYPVAILNTIASGESLARVITWINSATGADLAQYHLVGYSLGGQLVGVLGRNLGGKVGYITSLDPAGPGWEDNAHKFRPTDGVYTEVIHTSLLGYLEPCADVDFYPNGGRVMPGCIHFGCDHDRAFYYLAESLVTGGFTGTRCEDRPAAQAGNCTLPETLPMGGLFPKTGRSGIYYLETNPAPPFSQG